jgi:integrase
MELSPIGSWKADAPECLQRMRRAGTAVDRRGARKLPPVLSPEEVKRILSMATSLKARVMLTISYGCGLRAGEVVRLRACDIDSTQMIIRVVQSKGRKDRHVMLPPEVLDLEAGNGYLDRRVGRIDGRSVRSSA